MGLLHRLRRFVIPYARRGAVAQQINSAPAKQDTCFRGDSGYMSKLSAAIPPKTKPPLFEWRLN